MSIPSISRFHRYELLVLVIASAIFMGSIVSPPALMDDVDAVQATIARNMIQTGDWVTPHLDGIRYFEKPPLKYWLIASSFKLLGVHDYSARLPLALIDVLLCWLVFRMGAWAFGERAGLYAGLCLSTCIGLFLFTRILIADSQLTCAITVAMWSFLRALDEDEPHPRRWGLLFWASLAIAILLKGLIGAVFPVAAAGLFLVFSGQLFRRATWRRLMPGWGLLLFLAIAAPWHLLATLRNPPYIRLSMYSGPGDYRGFFWFYFFNEHILRFLNRRYPRDYDTVPRLLFWALNLLWLFPWSAYLPVLLRLSYSGKDRAARLRLLALCWGAFVMLFFSLSSTQEYYSMPIYPAIALLIGSGLAANDPVLHRWSKWSNALLAVTCAAASLTIFVLLFRVWNLPTPGDISEALHSEAASSTTYSLSLGHMGDLTVASLAYLRFPLMMAALALLMGLASLCFLRSRLRFFGLALMMVIFFHAARLAMVTFDPFLSSQRLATALMQSPPGPVIVTEGYYTYSSVLFYADRKALLLNGKINNLEYGSNAPGAPQVFLTDSDLARVWRQPQRYYLLVEHELLPSVSKLLGDRNYQVVKESGGRYLLTNLPLREAQSALIYLPAAGRQAKSHTSS